MAYAEDEPALPEGLEDASDEPALPTGLGDAGGDEPALPSGLGEAEPGLPAGLGDEADASVSAAEEGGFTLPFEWSGTFDLNGGLRVQDDPGERRSSMGELRLHLRGENSWESMGLTAALAADFIYDHVLGEHEPDLETGEGAIDLREASLVASPWESIDLKIGRQVLTWGTGDLLFINDMFPKDWDAFLIGRDMEYLKAPSDALKASIFHELMNIDLVYTPRFDADRFPDRRRLSSWDPMQQAIVGRETLVATDTPDDWFVDGEFAARVHRRIGRYEVAAYGYRGYWKSPAGMDRMTGKATFPKLSVYGGSARRPLVGGIFSVEGGYYDSRSNRGGENPFVRNSEIRGLVGFERDLAKELTLGVQYHVEFMRHHGLYATMQPPGAPLADQARQLATVRLTWLALNQSLRTTFYAQASPTDQDAALMPNASYTIDDHWRAQVGANIFVGSDEHTFFGQLQNNSSAYGALRYAW
ncbi:MAG: hypothetical protein GY811_24645 [Myxococcales bacterium]|nr:hypothetical protein [Myxococcales bacterium]